MSVRPSSEEETQTAHDSHVVSEAVHEAQVSWLRWQWLLPHYQAHTAREDTIKERDPFLLMVGPEVRYHHLTKHMKLISQADLVRLPQDGLDDARRWVE